MHVPSSSRGLTQIDWLRSLHSFSFGEYFDAERKGFRALRVINEDWVDAGKGFPQHPHRDMEILTWVLEGALEHRDTLGNVARIEPGQIQRMSAGKGIEHSEWNAEKNTTHLLQIWIRPNRLGLAPSYDQKTIDRNASRREWLEVAGPVASENKVKIHQDASVWFGELREQETRSYTLMPGRGLWAQIISGSGAIDNNNFSTGDGFGIENLGDGDQAVSFLSHSATQILLFDLA